MAVMPETVTREGVKGGPNLEHQPRRGVTELSENCQKCVAPGSFACALE